MERAAQGMKALLSIEFVLMLILLEFDFAITDVKRHGLNTVRRVVGAIERLNLHDNFIVRCIWTFLML